MKSRSVEKEQGDLEGDVIRRKMEMGIAVLEDNRKLIEKHFPWTGDHLAQIEQYTTDEKVLIHVLVLSYKILLELERQLQNKTSIVMFIMDVVYKYFEGKPVILSFLEELLDTEGELATSHFSRQTIEYLNSSPEAKLFVHLSIVFGEVRKKYKKKFGYEAQVYDSIFIHDKTIFVLCYRKLETGKFKLKPVTKKDFAHLNKFYSNLHKTKRIGDIAWNVFDECNREFAQGLLGFELDIGIGPSKDPDVPLEKLVERVEVKESKTLKELIKSHFTNYMWSYKHLSDMYLGVGVLMGLFSLVSTVGGVWNRAGITSRHEWLGVAREEEEYLIKDAIKEIASYGPSDEWIKQLTAPSMPGDEYSFKEEFTVDGNKAGTLRAKNIPDFAFEVVKKKEDARLHFYGSATLYDGPRDLYTDGATKISLGDDDAELLTRVSHRSIYWTKARLEQKRREVVERPERIKDLTTEQLILERILANPLNFTEEDLYFVFAGLVVLLSEIGMKKLFEYNGIRDHTCLPFRVTKRISRNLAQFSEEFLHDFITTCEETYAARADALRLIYPDMFIPTKIRRVWKLKGAHKAYGISERDTTLDPQVEYMESTFIPTTRYSDPFITPTKIPGIVRENRAISRTGVLTDDFAAVVQVLGMIGIMADPELKMRVAPEKKPPSIGRDDPDREKGVDPVGNKLPEKLTEQIQVIRETTLKLGLSPGLSDWGGHNFFNYFTNNGFVLTSNIDWQHVRELGTDFLRYLRYYGDDNGEIFVILLHDLQTRKDITSAVEYNGNVTTALLFFKKVYLEALQLRNWSYDIGGNDNMMLKRLLLLNQFVINNGNTLADIGESTDLLIEAYKGINKLPRSRVELY